MNRKGFLNSLQDREREKLKQKQHDFFNESDSCSDLYSDVEKKSVDKKEIKDQIQKYNQLFWEENEQNVVVESEHEEEEAEERQVVETGQVAMTPIESNIKNPALDQLLKKIHA